MHEGETMMQEQNRLITPYERVRTALAHKEPDRIPFDLGSTKMTGISIRAYRKYIGYKGWQDLDPEPAILDPVQQLALVAEPVLQRLDVDTRGLLPGPPAGYQTVYREENSYSLFTDEWGIVWKMPIADGHYFDMTAHPLGGDLTPADLERYPWPDPRDMARTAAFRARIGTLRQAGEPALVMHGVSAGILEMALRLRGFEQLFMDFALDPDVVCALLDRLVAIKIAYWEQALDWFGADVLVAIEADDLGAQDSLLISPEMYRRYVLPRHKRLFGAIKRKAPHIKVFLHSCGAIRPLVPDLIEAGVDILNPVQVSASGMDPKALKRDFGDVLTFWGGGIDTQHVLPFGSPDEVREEVKRRIDELAPGGGFVFNTIHNIQSDVPPRNLDAMLETFARCAKY
jgi:uroporphyrinogen decarboxylase